MQIKATRKETLWIGTILLAVVFTAIEVPFALAFQSRVMPWQIWVDVLISLLFVGDLVYHIRSYLEQKDSVFYQNKGRSWPDFAINGLACIPFEVISYAVGGGGSLFNLIRVLRLIRLMKFVSVFNNLPNVLRNLRIFLISTSSLIMIHFLACFWGYLHPGDGPVFDRYVQCLYWTVTTLTTVGYGDITPETTATRLYTMLVMMGGVGAYALIIGNITRFFADAARYKEQTRKKFNDLSIFMRHYRIPKKLQVSVFNYYNHIYSKRLSGNDQRIISDLPQSLKNELQVHMNVKLVRNLPVFQHCSEACLKAVAEALRQEHYAPGDGIIKIGEVGDEMFLIGHGTVDVSLENGDVVNQLHEGQFFGEAALLKETTRNANVRATGHCDLYRFSKRKFLGIIKDHPELLENMEKIVKRRAVE